MATTWLADADPRTCWAHQPWPRLGAQAQPEYAVVVLPVHGFANHGANRPVDIEEVLGGRLLRSAVARAAPRFALRVLPPLRFVTAAADGFFGVDLETVHDALREIAGGVRAAGFHKLVLFNTSATNEPVVAAAAVDLRVGLGLRPYVIHARSLGLDYSRHQAGDLGPLAEHLAGLLGEIRAHLAPPLEPESGGPPAPATLETDIYPAYRPWYLPGLSATQLAAAGVGRDLLAVLPVAAVEQHGPHLPLGVDAILGQALLAAALSRLPTAAPVLVAPAGAYGKSNEHLGFPGTITLSARTLRRLVLGVARQLRALGVRRFAVLNTHGGNSAVLPPVLEEVRATLAMETLVLRPELPPDLPPQEAAWGFHAGEWETALMLACAPELVRLDLAVAEYPARLTDAGALRPENAPANFAWMTRDLSRSGVMGDPTTATAEKGRRWLAFAAERLADRILSALGS
jgi:creatinine amidohydrolase